MSKMEQLRAWARSIGAIRSRDLAALGIPRTYLGRLAALELLTRVSRGVYVSPDAEMTTHHSLAEVGVRVPQGVICLQSALQFHEMTTQAPFQVWLAIANRARAPRLDYPPLRICRFSEPTLTAGVEIHEVEGVPVRVFSPAKTVADCFKYRNKVGLDVALEALHDYWRGGRGSLDELWQHATTCRVANVMRPYLEAITWSPM